MRALKAVFGLSHHGNLMTAWPVLSLVFFHGMTAFISVVKRASSRNRSASVPTKE
jgi:hypothetical protein